MPFLKGTCPAIAVFLTVGIGLLAIVGCGADCKDPCGPGVPRGALRVSSIPPGASILLDGSPTGRTTDATLVGVREGPHVVRVNLSGYDALPETLLVDVVAGDTADAAFTLTLSGTGAIAVFSEPPGAAIFLDGAPTERTTPDTLEGVPKGERVVRVALDGYRSFPESLPVTVKEDSIAVASFTLAEIIPRIVFVEHFSNTSCDPCREVEENLETALSQLGHGLVAIGNHLNWPAPNDPFYLANAAQLNQRGRVFNVSYMPHLRIDGAFFANAENYDALLARIAAAAAVEPLFRIDVSTAIVADSFVIAGTIEKIGDTVEGDEALVAVIIETNIDYEAANGLTHFDDIVRRFLPGTNGEPLSLGVGESFGYRYAEALSAAWNAGNLEAVVFVESRSTRKVYQAGSTRTLGKP
ncbi:MAG: PEGA domain-containing protein [Candidatus Eisenbacteria bacterium]|nr:PEGA domain-containing protein [Candidatus Eisenbacteria bacterium]